MCAQKANDPRLVELKKLGAQLYTCDRYLSKLCKRFRWLLDAYLADESAVHGIHLARLDRRRKQLAKDPEMMELEKEVNASRKSWCTARTFALKNIPVAHHIIPLGF